MHFCNLKFLENRDFADQDERAEDSRRWSNALGQAPPAES